MTTNHMGLEQESRLSEEELKRIADDDHVQCGDASAMARELLAYREAGKKPVAYTSQLNLDKMLTNEGYLPFMSKNRSIHAAPIALYTAPPIQAVTVPDVAEDVYRVATHIASSKNGLPQEWVDWAEEIESDLRIIRDGIMKSVTNEP